ncbi:uncharacterized protein [Physcomitrium patens]|uniref:uncharacterized protein isoform X2 n=1 Tax=Physcomitrium patens TaxID=3218 RepID=UPI000D1514C1|nr:ubiquinone biosynthesis monooxygenase COQ6, mitochondrial-like isoform X2 [Physcomitrium patens]|eukprot:XP_024366568.1 ubiquinone biosynthesis monooxygenase COQ6, mitochondrial-like isoform X2 [Physcomitrella patens]
MSTNGILFFGGEFLFSLKSSMEKKQAGSEDEYDVVIVGGGMVGAAVGCGLACSPLSRDLRVAIIDSSKPMAAPKHDPKAVPDQRVSAITPATVRFFKEVGAWESVQAAMPTPFDAMQVWDYEGLGYTRYTADDVGAYVLGYVVENKVLLGALRSRIENAGSVDFICPAQVKSVLLPTPSGQGLDSPQDRAEVGLNDGRSLRARLVVGADGGRSAVRATAGFQTRGWEYKQSAVICTVRVETNHATAFQRFLPTGPFALLPLNDTYSNIVWTTTPEKADALKTMSAEQFVVEANKALIDDHGPKPGSKIAEIVGNVVTSSPLLGAMGPSASEPFQEPPRIVDCATPRLSFPLSLMHASNYVGHRVALVGDAAHTVHPLAGQGVNLGFGDAASLSKVLQKGVETGHDIGQIDLLEEYERERKRTNLTMMAILDGFQKMYSSDFGPLKYARSFGFNAVHALGPLKKQIISYAMGV